MRWRAPFVVVVLLIGLLQGEAMAAGKVRIAVAGGIERLDPHVFNETLTLGVLSNVMEGLVRRDAQLRLKPALAEDWQVLSARHWRFHLRRGVRFHDGSPFTAEDVLFSFERARKPGSQLRARIPDDARLIAVDDHTVDVLLDEPNPILNADWESLLIMSRRWAERHGLDAPGAVAEPQPALAANGTGAYRVVSHSAGQVTRFEANPAWWGRREGMAERVELHTLTHAPTRTAGLLSGQVDVIVPAPIQDLERISAARGFKTVTGAELRTIFLNMDQMRDDLVGAAAGTPNPFRDRRVREAVAHAIDVEMIRRQVMRGHAVPAASLVSPLILPEVKDIARRAYNPARARQLLAAAGYGDGFEVTLDCPNDRYVNDEQICLAIVQMLADVDIRVRLNAQPKSLYFKKVLSGGGYDSAFNLLGWTPGAFDAWNVLNNLARCRDAAGNGARFNLGGYCNERVDQLTAAARREVDPARRTRHLVEAFGLIHEDAGFVPLHQQSLAWAMAERIETTVRADNMIKFDMLRIRPQATGRSAQADGAGGARHGGPVRAQ